MFATSRGPVAAAHMDMESTVAATEVARHSLPSDCWLAINGRVYDMTNFAPEHPGGASSNHPPIPAVFAPRVATD